jgi:hypothetical protein
LKVISGAGRHGIVDIESLALAFAGFVLVAQEKGIGVFRRAVERAEQHVITPVEDILGAVAVVEVHIENGDPFRAAVEKTLGGNRHVVEEAVAAIEIVMGMVARRPAQGKRMAGTR